MYPKLHLNFCLAMLNEASDVDYCERESSIVKRHALSQSTGRIRGSGGRRCLNPTTQTLLASGSPSPPAFQVALNGNIKTYPHQDTRSRQTLSVVSTHEAKPNVRDRPVDTD